MSIHFLSVSIAVHPARRAKASRFGSDIIISATNRKGPIAKSERGLICGQRPERPR